MTDNLTKGLKLNPSFQVVKQLKKATYPTLLIKHERQNLTTKVKDKQVMKFFRDLEKLQVFARYINKNHFVISDMSTHFEILDRLDRLTREVEKVNLQSEKHFEFIEKTKTLFNQSFAKMPAKKPQGKRRAKKSTSKVAKASTTTSTKQKRG